RPVSAARPLGRTSLSRDADVWHHALSRDTLHVRYAAVDDIAGARLATRRAAALVLDWWQCGIRTFDRSGLGIASFRRGRRPDDLPAGPSPFGPEQGLIQEPRSVALGAPD